MDVSEGRALDDGYLEVPGGRLYYEVEGEGHPLALIHAGIAHLRMWDDQVPVFAERYQVIRYDTRGFGRTRSDEVEFSNRADLASLLEQLGVERTHLVGLSRGATIALDFALEFPDRVSALVFVASSPSGFEADAPELTEAFAELERLYEGKEWDRLVEAETRLWVDGPGQATDRVDPTVRQRMVRWNTENYSAEAGEGKPQPLDPPAAGRLGEVTVPTLVMWGDLDEPGVLAGSPLVADGIPGARRHMFEGVAHMVNLERPLEFNRRVLDFLADAETNEPVSVPRML